MDEHVILTLLKEAEQKLNKGLKIIYYSNGEGIVVNKYGQINKEILLKFNSSEDLKTKLFNYNHKS